MRLSVVIPTRDRARTLEQTLDSLDAQAIDPGAAELVVVDNGSRDDTPALLERLAAAPRRLELRVVTHAAPGASGARNAGMRAAVGDVVLFLGDDTAPARPDLLASHLGAHHATPDPAYALLGRVAWAPRLQVTPLMRWLEHGPQFAFATMQAGPAGPEHFYTAHLSLKAAALAAAGGFDERVAIYFEDSELGDRLFRDGLRLDYRPDLLVLHDHEVTLAGWLERQERAGRSGRRLHDLRAIDERLVPRPGGWRWGAARTLAALAGRPRSEWRRLPRPLRERLYAAAHYAAYARGFAGGD